MIDQNSKHWIDLLQQEVDIGLEAPKSLVKKENKQSWVKLSKGTKPSQVKKQDKLREVKPTLSQNYNGNGENPWWWRRWFTDKYIRCSTNIAMFKEWNGQSILPYNCSSQQTRPASAEKIKTSLQHQQQQSPQKQKNQTSQDNIDENCID